MRSRLFAEKIIHWYDDNKRDLPWRNTKDPYRIWLSEIILQQTRVVQGLPYYQAFTTKFPLISDLAQADEQEVLRTWQGLGYYSRARNLHKCAKIICNEYDGRFPDNYKELLALPGIGPYTAAAIASFAFREPKAVVDGNVYRVLSRFFGIEDDIASTPSQKKFSELAQTLISPTQPDIYNQGIMEFGAIQCKPKSPNCNECTLNDECVARNESTQDKLPIKSKKVKIRERYFYYFNLVVDDRLLMRKREGKGIWEGLFDFNVLESPKSIDVEEAIEKNSFISSLKADLSHVDVSQEYLHILSHQRINAIFITAYLNKGPGVTDSLPKNHAFYTLTEVNELPKPVLISHYLNDTFF
ncbi:MAG: A/G-specific adenine glycosylase [Bacteroidota bacterium]